VNALLLQLRGVLPLNNLLQRILSGLLQRGFFSRPVVSKMLRVWIK
jgi:hypothetical protein